MSITILHNPKCSKSRQGLELIHERGLDVEVREYLKSPLSNKELGEIIQALGIKPEQLIRKGEADYKDNFKGKELTDEEWINAMVQFPKLIERPIVIKEKKAVIGRPLENILELIK